MRRKRAKQHVGSCASCSACSSSRMRRNFAMTILFFSNVVSTLARIAFRASSCCWEIAFRASVCCWEACVSIVVVWRCLCVVRDCGREIVYCWWGDREGGKSHLLYHLRAKRAYVSRKQNQQVRRRRHHRTIQGPEAEAASDCACCHPSQLRHHGA